MIVQSTFIWANYLLPNSPHRMISHWRETERENWSWSLLGVKGLKLSLLMLLLNYILQFSDFWLFYFCLSLRLIYLLLFCSLSLYIGKTVADFSFSILLQTFFLIQVQICTKLAWITSWSTYTDQLLENYPLRDYSMAIIIQNPPPPTTTTTTTITTNKQTHTHWETVAYIQMTTGTTIFFDPRTFPGSPSVFWRSLLGL